MKRDAARTRNVVYVCDSSRTCVKFGQPPPTGRNDERAKLIYGRAGWLPPRLGGAFWNSVKFRVFIGAMWCGDSMNSNWIEFEFDYVFCYELAGKLLVFFYNKVFFKFRFFLDLHKEVSVLCISNERARCRSQCQGRNVVTLDHYTDMLFRIRVVLLIISFERYKWK